MNTKIGYLKGMLEIGAYIRRDEIRHLLDIASAAEDVHDDIRSGKFRNEHGQAIDLASFQELQAELTKVV